MGVSTDGIIAFGFPVGGEEEPPGFLEAENDEGEAKDFDDIRAADLGITEKCPSGEKLTPHPADLITHCSYDYPMYFLAVNGTKVRAHRGFPQVFDLPTITDEQIAALKTWCEEYSVEWQEPRWYLMSLWG